MRRRAVPDRGQSLRLWGLVISAGALLGCRTGKDRDVAAAVVVLCVPVWDTRRHWPAGCFCLLAYCKQVEQVGTTKLDCGRLRGSASRCSVNFCCGKKCAALCCSKPLGS
jgi:hypothetical protein